MSETKTSPLDTSRLPLELDVVAPTDLPPDIARRFLAASSTYGSGEEKPGFEGFEAMYKAQYPGDDIVTYVGCDSITFMNRETKFAYLLDVNTADEQVGNGHIVFHVPRSTYEEGKPYVGHTRTFQGFLRAGYGTRRLEIMDDLAQRLYGQHLHSSTLLQPEAQANWEKLVHEGVAVSYQDGEHTRFTFV